MINQLWSDALQWSCWSWIRFWQSWKERRCRRTTADHWQSVSCCRISYHCWQRLITTPSRRLFLSMYNSTPISSSTGCWTFTISKLQQLQLCTYHSPDSVDIVVKSFIMKCIRHTGRTQLTVTDRQTDRYNKNQVKRDKKAVLSQGNRAMPSCRSYSFRFKVRRQHSLQV